MPTNTVTVQIICLSRELLNQLLLTSTIHNMFTQSAGVRTCVNVPTWHDLEFGTLAQHKKGCGTMSCQCVGVARVVRTVGTLLRPEPRVIAQRPVPAHAADLQIGVRMKLAQIVIVHFPRGADVLGCRRFVQHHRNERRRVHQFARAFQIRAGYIGQLLSQAPCGCNPFRMSQCVHSKTKNADIGKVWS